MNSAERIREYSHIPQEAEAVIDSSRPPAEWPSKGEIVFENVSYRYREGLPLVLKNVQLRSNFLSIRCFKLTSN